MGLDISFSREEAVEAGMETSAMRNGSDASIQLAEEDEANGMPTKMDTLNGCTRCSK